MLKNSEFLGPTGGYLSVTPIKLSRIFNIYDLFKMYLKLNTNSKSENFIAKPPSPQLDVPSSTADFNLKTKHSHNHGIQQRHLIV